MKKFCINNKTIIIENALANCHATVFSYLNDEVVTTDRDTIINALWPNGYQQEYRVLSIDNENTPGDISMIQPGSIIGFWTNYNGRFQLQHSMIALNHNTWIGTNNLGVMGSAAIIFRNVDKIIYGGAATQPGWYGQNGDLHWKHINDSNPPTCPLFVTARTV